MKSARAIIGLPVLVGSRVVGHVTGLALDYKNKLLTGLYLTSMPFGSRFITLNDVEILGDVSVIAKNAGVRSKPDEAKDIRALAPDGSGIGRVTGALIEETRGVIKAVEVSKGLWEDILYGRQWVFNYASGKDSPGVFIYPKGGCDDE